ETSIIFWCAIVVFYLQFTLSNLPLDYKFLALFRMTDMNSFANYINFGLSTSEFIKFSKFRKIATRTYHSINGNIPFFAVICIVGLYLQTGQFYTHPILSIFWTILTSILSAIICTVIYGNLIAFTVVI